MAIPRIIHQTARAYDELPAEIKANIERIKSLNPQWEHRFYEDADVLRYIERHSGPRMLRACRRINPRYGVMLADVFRYLAVYREGGVYLDVKSTVTRPLDEVLSPDDSYLLSQWRNRLGERYRGWGLYPDLERIIGGEFQQWHIIAVPKHPFLARVIQDVLFNMEHYHPGWFDVGAMGVLRVSGPICYSLAIAPMLSHYKHRIVDIEELGISYTIYDSTMHHRRPKAHYTHSREPIMLRADDKGLQP